MTDGFTDDGMAGHDVDGARCWVLYELLTSWRAAAIDDDWPTLVAPFYRGGFRHPAASPSPAIVG